MNFFVRAMLIACVVMQGAVALPVFAQDAAPPTGAQTAPTRTSNTQGTAGQAATQAVAQPASSACELNGVHDPFCNKSISQIIGRIVQFVVSIAGALFLAMFVYGGAVWLTAGDSKRQEDAQKTLLNASFGVLIVIASYTIIAVLIGFVGGLGVSQGNVTPVTPPDTRTPAAVTPTNSATREAPTACDENRFSEPCLTSCTGAGGSADSCDTEFCPRIYRQVCPGGTVPASTDPSTRAAQLDTCQARCVDGCATVLGQLRRDASGTAGRSVFARMECNTVCPDWCRAAFAETRAVGR